MDPAIDHIDIDLDERVTVPRAQQTLFGAVQCGPVQIGHALLLSLPLSAHIHPVHGRAL